MARRWRDALPGQFVTLKLEPGHGAPPLVRSYSLSGPPDGARYRISVKVEPHGAAGQHLRATVDVGDRVKVAAPRGQFTLDDGHVPGRAGERGRRRDTRARHLARTP